MKITNFLIAIFISVTLFSCIDEPAPPATDIREEITREWNAEEDDDGFPLNFTVQVTKDPNDDTKILISNFHNLGSNATAYAIVYENNTIELPEQTIGNTVIKGTGSIATSYERIDWEYTAEEENIVNVTGTFTIGDIAKAVQ